MRTNSGSSVSGIRNPKTKNAKKKIKSLMNHWVRAPLRVLVKARDLYVKNMLDCAGNTTSYRVVYPVSGTLQFPMTEMYFPETAVEEKVDLEEIYRELIRAASAAAAASASSLSPSRGAGVSEAVVAEEKVSYGVRVGRLGRIDEDKICEFVEDDDEQDSFRTFRIFGF